MYDSNKRRFGDHHELLVRDHLIEKGYEFITKNFRLGRSGEIDLIFREGRVWVFVEVKARRSHSAGLPEDAVTPAKRAQIRRLAERFLENRGVESYEARFDVVAVDYATGDDGDPEVRHMIDAFR